MSVTIKSLYIFLLIVCLPAYSKRIVRVQCPETIIINKTNLPWNNHDQQTLDSIKKRNRCNVQEPGYPCLIKFYKIGFQNYYVECGRKRVLNPGKSTNE